MKKKIIDFKTNPGHRFGLLDRLLMRVFRHRVIPDSCGRPYLVRYFVLGGGDSGADDRGSKSRPPHSALYLHHILLSDEARDLHDHPWPFWSLILWGGYREVMPIQFDGGPLDGLVSEVAIWRRPLTVVRRKASDSHRVELIDGPCWSLVWRGPRERTWGFYSKTGWVPWREYAPEGGPCEDEA